MCIQTILDNSKKLFVVRVELYCFLILLLVFGNVPFVNGQYDAALKSYLPTSPTAASFAKTAELPVSYFSGSTNISVPLVEAKDNLMSHSVSLNYNTSGIKASETSSSVGLGWNLSAGGAITRAMRHAPDETAFDDQLSGYYSHGVNLSWFTNSEFDNIVSGKRDIESDIYYYNFGNYSGSFSFHSDQTIIFKEKNDLKVIPISTGYAYNKWIWKIITPEGDVFYFGDTTISDGVGDDAVSYTNQYSQPRYLVGAPDRTNPLVDSWFLVRAESFDGTSAIDFEYDQYEAYSFRDLGTSATLHIDEDGMNLVSVIPVPFNDLNPVLCTEALTARLTKVVTDTRQIVFEYSGETRRDLDNTATSGYHPQYVVGVPSNKIVTAKPLKTIKVLTPNNTLLSKYELSYDYFRSTNAGFEGTLGLTQQTDEYGIYYSDMRRLRLDTIKLISDDEVIQVQILEYYNNQVQRRLTYAQDDHGYPNGVTANTSLLPALLIDTLAASTPLIDLTAQGLLANRSAVTSAAKNFMLKKITFPTGGHRTIDYEGHDYRTNTVVESPDLLVDLRNANCSSPFPPSDCETCCLGQRVESGSVVINPATTFRYKMTVSGRKTPNDMSSLPIDLLVYIKPGTGAWQIYDNLVLNSGNGYNVMKCYGEGTFPYSNTGSYQFAIEALPTRKLFMQLLLVEYERTDLMVNKPVGGLRVKSIIDQPIDGPAITKTYTYETAEGSNISSGYLVGLPFYAEKLPLDASLNVGGTPSEPLCIDVAYRFTSGNTFALGSVQGSHIGYSRVTERTGTGQGYDEYEFITDAMHKARYTTNFPAIPEILIDDKTGYLNVQRTYDGAGNLVASNAHTYAVYDYSNINTSYKARQYSICDGGVNVQQNYIIPSKRVYKVSNTAIKDNVSTASSYEYASLATHTNMTSQTVVNSNGKQHRTEYSYIFDYPFNTTLKNEMIAQNRINAPWQTISKVNNVIVDGNRIKYAYMNPSNGNMYATDAVHIGQRSYPALEERREITWSTDNIVDNGWHKQKETKQAHILTSRPSVINIAGWAQDHQLNWTNSGKLGSYTYSNFTTSYQYDAVTDEISGKTNIDGTTESYIYDKLIRLKTMTQQPKNVITTYNYYFSNLTTNKSYVKSKIKYQLTTSSSIDSIVNYMYVDGLGRGLQNINKYAAPNGTADVISKTEYDNQGRQYRSYEPISVGSNNGIFYTGAFSGGFTQQLYQANPLDRPDQTTPPVWQSTNHSYSTNATALTNPEGLVYPINSLILTTTTDPDGKHTDIYTDKIGRQILQRRRQSTNTNDTWTVYDDKDRPIKNYPPGSSPSTTGLIFEYRYDGEDNMIYKKVPDSGAEEYRYDGRNLMVAHRNPVMLAQNRWLVTHYDDYGRPSKRGYFNGATPTPADVPTIHTLLEEYFYDGFNGSSTNTAPIYKGKLRKKRIKALNDLATNTTWVETQYSYDIYGRVSQENITNHLGETEIISYTYDFADNVMTNSHLFIGDITHQTRYTYDHQGRKGFERHTFNNGIEVTTSQCRYDHKNQIIERNLGRHATIGTHQYLQSLDYTYNPQGWLTGINTLFTDLIPLPFDPCVGGTESVEEPLQPITTDEQDLFALSLDFNSTLSGSGIPASQNGNITALKWWHRNSGQYNQSYTYRYDFLNRVTEARHGEIIQGVHTLKNQYNEKMSYDPRGNFTILDRRGMVQRPDLNEQCYRPMTIDSLTYVYESGTNKLVQVIDNAPCLDTITLPAVIDRDVNYAAGQLIRIKSTDVLCNVNMNLTAGTEIRIIDTLHLPNSCGTPALVIAYQGPCPQNKYTEGFNQQSISGQYTYDTGGNMTHDPNKKLTFYYNHLNLPYRIEGSENDELQMLYDANGTLLQRKYVKNNTEVSKIDYLRGKERINGVLKNIYFSDGRIIKTDAAFSFEYAIKDHLGNIRVTFADDNNNGLLAGAEIRSRNDYYTFGMEWDNYLQQGEFKNPVNRFQYNGKEYFQEMELDQYAYGARFYDAVLGRFTGVDALSSDFTYVNPYNYAENNPIVNIDLHGLQALNAFQAGLTGNDDQGYIRPATPSFRENSPFLAGVGDATFLVLDFIGLNALDNAFFGSQESTTGQKVAAVGTVLLNTRGGVDDGLKSSSKVVNTATVKSDVRASTLEPGPYAKESIKTDSRSQKFTKEQRAEINKIGKEHGCHTCGNKDPGTKSNNFVPDHQPVGVLNPNYKSFDLFPHCISCSKSQGGTVRQIVSKNKKK